MPNITRGSRMTGLMAYLAGSGRSNEHSEPHLVAGDRAIMAWHEPGELGHHTALQVGWQLDHPRRAFGTRVTTAVKDPDGRNVGVKDAHVWHCSLSLRADEPALSDAQWAQISEQFVARMGFNDPASRDAPCRWAAVRHGASKAGNDHVHIVVGLVREDGAKAKVWNDRPNAQRVAGELEREHGLQVLESRDVGHTARGHKPAEREIAARRGAPESAREQLARTVRACAAAAGDEAEFVRRVRRAGVRIRPRYATGRGDVVAGYSVALHPPAGSVAVWHGGGHLARDLTLPRLRADWPDTPQQASAALAEWGAAKRNQRPVTTGREAAEPAPELWATYTTEVTALREQLRRVPLDDRALWAHVARETAGAFAAWSLRVEQTPGPLAATAETLARSAQLRAHQIRPRKAGLPSARGAALLLFSISHGGSGSVAEAVLLRQLANVAKALHDHHTAAGDAARASQIATVVRTQLASVSAALPPVEPGPARPSHDADAVEAVRIAAQAHPGPRAPGSPIPDADDVSARPANTPSPQKTDIER
jgi:Relaxase/Mobilisation nuclease domain